jgi:hypothetical protein
VESNEIKKEMAMTYNELVEYLLKKYGKAQYDYFSTASCKSKNPKVTRTKEGLYCHHIDEDKAIMLSTDKFAINNPFEYQKADRLVYCNVLEHLMLHIKIFEEPKHEKANAMEIQGLGGVINFICPQMNDFYGGKEPSQDWRVSIVNQIRDNFDDYIIILKYFLKILEGTPFSAVINKKTVSVGWEGEIIQKIYAQL